jgi:hypothetical protein
VVTFAGTLASMAHLGVWFSDPSDKDPHHILRVVLAVFSGLFGLLLVCFFVSQSYMILSDITSNEQLRDKWNNSRSYQLLGIRAPGWGDRFRYFFGKARYRSRVETHA